MLLAEFVRAAVDPADQNSVLGPQPVMPDGLCQGETTRVLSTSAFLEIAERCRRDEIVHSLLAVNFYAATIDPKEKRKLLRVEKEHGFSGPTEGDPKLVINYPAESSQSQIILLDDTGNRFRKKTPENPWPTAIEQANSTAGENPIFVYKLHRPLPDTPGANLLWEAVAKHHPRNRLVVISVDDLRLAGAPISLGLSWERTALDVVWHLLNVESFSELRSCPHLVIRLDLDGAILWQCSECSPGCPEYQAWLIYDPTGIEGSFALNFPGRMVGCGSVFTAAIAQKLATADSKDFFRVNELIQAIKSGVMASRRILKFGFGEKHAAPHYPGAELFVARGKDDAPLAAHPIPIILHALEPDRGGWRLLDDIFENKTASLYRAVGLTATGHKPSETKGEDGIALKLLEEVPLGVFGALRTYDRGEIEHYRALHTLLRDYLCTPAPPRPLSIAVFGPPGAGKSFGVKEVALSLRGQRDCKEVEILTFNLSLYQKPEELAGAFHLVRDVSLRGKLPLVFFDEFDTQALSWLRYFLAPMQDGEFLDRGVPHPVGQAIFVFAGGTAATFQEFSSHPGVNISEFKAVKGPDFLSRLRATLDIPSLNFGTACEPQSTPGSAKGDLHQPPDTFDPYGDVDAFPCEAAILLRRAGILAFNLQKKAPQLILADGSLALDPAVLRALLRLPGFAHGNRSFEAILDMSHLNRATSFTPSLLPAPFQIPLHADAEHFEQLVGTAYPYSPTDRWLIAKEIHKHFVEERQSKGEYQPDKASHQNWEKLSDKYRNSNAEQADDIPRKLLALSLWLRKIVPSSAAPLPSHAAELPLTKDELDTAARLEHDRWVSAQRCKGYIQGAKDNPILRTHPCILPWSDPGLSDAEKDKDRAAIRAIPRYLAAAKYEVIKP
jgi:hypothetical protein